MLSVLSVIAALLYIGWVGFLLAGNGYVRSEGVVVLYVQKKRVAKRIYADILGIRDGCDGYKEKGEKGLNVALGAAPNPFLYHKICLYQSGE